MSKTKDPLIQKFQKFEDMLESPKGPLQKALRLGFKLSLIPLYPLTKIYPFSLGADYGRLWNIQEKQGYRKAVEFGCVQLTKYRAKLDGKSFFLGSAREAFRQTTWMLFARTAEYAYWDPKPQDIEILGAIATDLGLQAIGDGPSTAFSALARLAWVLNKQDDSWHWVERATLAHNENADAHYLKGWMAIVLGRGNPIDSLCQAITLEPNLLVRFRRDQTLIQYPHFMSAIEARARELDISVVQK